MLPRGMCFLAISLLLLSCSGTTHAFPAFRAEIPSGMEVPCPPSSGGSISGCSINGICEGVGHHTCEGGSLPLNPFGRDLLENGYKWTEKLCRTDSDNDGFTNGVELSDPCCFFKRNTTLYADKDYPKLNQRFLPRILTVGNNVAGKLISHPGFPESTLITSFEGGNEVNGERFSTSSISLEEIDSVCQQFEMEKKLDPSSSQDNLPRHREDPFMEDEPRMLLNLTLPLFQIPRQQTTYLFTYVDLNQLYIDQIDNNSRIPPTLHIVGYKADVDNLRYMHHILVKGCDTLGRNKHMEQSYNAMRGCDNVIAGWAPGGWSDNSNGVFSLPPEAGFPIIGRGTRYVMVEAHYTNFNGASGAFDQTAFEIYVTSKLRRYDAGATLLGPISGRVTRSRRGLPIGWRAIRVPPGHDAFEIRADCYMKEDETTIFATRAHGHLNMASAYLEKVENTNSTTFGVVKRFDYNYQPAVYVDGDGFKARKGDVIRAHCIYNTKNNR